MSIVSDVEVCFALVEAITHPSVKTLSTTRSVSVLLGIGRTLSVAVAEGAIYVAWYRKRSFSRL